MGQPARSKPEPRGRVEAALLGQDLLGAGAAVSGYLLDLPLLPPGAPAPDFVPCVVVRHGRVFRVTLEEVTRGG